MEISNKVALITGGASGLGLSTAKTLVESGAKVMLLDLNEDNAKAAVESLGGDSSYIIANVTEEESVQNAIDQATIVSAAIMGEPTAYKSIPWFWSDQYDLKIQIAGLSQDSDFLVTRGNKNDCKFSVCHFKNNRLKAVECVNDQKTFMLGKKLIEAESKITPEAIENIQTNLRDWK